MFLYESWSVHPQLDDAYISYRYALNLVEGRGLVFNPGEYVEGYTNLLWTLLVAGGLALGLIAIVAAVALPFVGNERLGRLIAWWCDQSPTLIRVQGALAFAFGAYMVYAIA